jgi:serine/threonine protein kinase
MLAVEDSASRYGMAYGLPNDGRPRNISSVDNQSDYEHKKTLDGGDVTKGGLNLGVHLVKRKRDGKLCVQKKIAGDQHDLLREVHLLHHLQHPYIVEFIDAFITKDPPTCSLYIEFADAGGLDEVIERFIQRNKEKEESSRIPEVCKV